MRLCTIKVLTTDVALFCRLHPRDFQVSFGDFYAPIVCLDSARSLRGIQWLFFQIYLGAVFERFVDFKVQQVLQWINLREL